MEALGVPVLQQTCLNNGSTAVLFAVLLNSLIGEQCKLFNLEQYPKDVAAENLLPEYDFIVIGAGSAGAAVANRLSEVAEWNVLVVEAGGDPGMTSEVPVLFFASQHTQDDWEFWPEADGTSCLGMSGGRCYWPRGKALGGTSVLNAMLYVRGSKLDYDGWQEMGNPGWGYEDVLGYFKKSENSDRSDEFHAQGGPLEAKMYKSGEPNLISDFFYEAAEEMGYEKIDINSATPVGYGTAPSTQKDSVRFSTAKAFLAPAKARKNLHVSKHSQVTKLLIDKSDNRVTGVEFVKGGESRVVSVGKEVVLSAGAIGSPHILLLSGIGPEEHLNEMGIQVVKNSKMVGKNLQDHILFLGNIFAMKKVDLEIGDKEKFELDQMYKYLVHKTGYYSTVGTYDFMAFINTPLNENKLHPDIQIHHLIIGAQDPLVWPLFLKVQGYDEQTTDYMKKLNENFTIFSPIITLLRPDSAGEIKLNSTNPLEKPVIYANYFSNQLDVRRIVEAVKFCKRFGETEAMKKLGAERIDDLESCSSKFGKDSDEYHECALRHIGSTIYHPVGTCKMGPDPATSVVDPELRVHGIKGLRVADASIMPKIVSGNTNAPSIMIGERVSDFIKNKWL